MHELLALDVHELLALDEHELLVYDVRVLMGLNANGHGELLAQDVSEHAAQSACGDAEPDIERMMVASDNESTRQQPDAHGRASSNATLRVSRPTSRLSYHFRRCSLYHRQQARN